MKALNLPQLEHQLEVVSKEHEQMVQDGMFQLMNTNYAISSGLKVIMSTWTMKKKCDGTYHASLVTRGFQQQEGLH